MKKLTFAICLSCLMLFALSNAHSVTIPTTKTYSFTPSDSDLGELPHEKAFKWGINWVLPGGEKIIEAVLTYKNIYDWTKEQNHLYTNLLDNVSAGHSASAPNGYVKVYSDTDNDFINKFASYSDSDHILLSDWTDTDGPATKGDLVIYVPSDNFGWLGDGNFGFGIDPDCHYYNEGVTFQITTDKIPEDSPPVPEPGTLMLLGSGLLGLTAYGKLRFDP